MMGTKFVGPKKRTKGLNSSGVSYTGINYSTNTKYKIENASFEFQAVCIYMLPNIRSITECLCSARSTLISEFSKLSTEAGCAGCRRY